MSNSTLNKNIRIAEYSILSAIILAMTFVPYLGYISYGGLSITLIHIPVIIGACALGIKGGTFLGTVWGTACLLKAVLAPPSPLEGIIFRNPLVSIVPRLLAGLIAGAIFTLFSKKISKKSICSTVSAIVACLTNTIFVMGFIYILYGEKYGNELGITSVNLGGLTNYVIAAFGINAVIEIITAVIITVPVINSIRKRHK